MQVRPFAIDIDPARLDDLRQRVRATRWPAAMHASDWHEGTSLAFMQRVAHHWIEDFDWRAQQARLNALPQFLAEIDGLDIHFVHQRGHGPDPLPLVITHGWPGSFAEMARIVPLLADPGAHGADPADAFHVVVPSLPGYGFSQAPDRPGFGPHRIAALWAELMAGLGYARYGAQGGDWGASVSTWLAQRYPQRVAGLHLNFIPGSYRPPLGEGLPPLSAEEQAFLSGIEAWAKTEGAYSHIQATKPLSLAYGLMDSPVALAAWMLEKFRAWSDCDGDVVQLLGLDALLTNVCLYWFSGTADATLRLYRENSLHPVHLQRGETVAPPLGVAQFPHELPMPPRSWVERGYNVARWTTMPKGGHFAAMEQPELLARELRAFFRPLRTPSAALTPN